LSGVITDHGELTGLEDDDHPQYIHNTEMATISGDIVAQIPTDYYTQSEVDSISGALSAEIDSDVATHASNTNAHHNQTHDNTDHSAAYITSTGVTYANLNANGDVGAGSAQVAQGDHDHDASYVKVSGDTMTGSLIVQGDLIVSGTRFITETETVQIEDNLLFINKGEIGAGVTKGEAGIEVDRGSETNYRFIFDETQDNFRVGVSGAEQAAATREDSPIPDGIAFWNNTEKRFDTDINVTIVSGAIYADEFHGNVSSMSGVLLRDGSTTLTSDWNFGSNSISGTGDIYCDDLYASATSLHLGDGVLRYTGSDYEGYVNGEWSSLTASGNLSRDESPALGGDLELGNYNFIYNTTPSGAFIHGYTVGSNGETSSMQVDLNDTGVGCPLHMKSNGHWEQCAAASGTSSIPCTAMALEEGTGSKKILWRGIIRKGAWSWTAGDIIYVSTVGGALTNTRPTNTGDIVQPIGVAIASDTIRFDPQLLWIEVE
jgi:hypothetical protein